MVKSLYNEKIAKEFNIVKNNPKDKVIALAGNPNVGKSTVFNNLTGMKQHTGNWPGKTVLSAIGHVKYKDVNYTLVDLPGTYSLFAKSAEEEVARNFICFGDADAVVVVCDATCLERNLNLVLQTIEIANNVILCLNLMDEAEKKKIRIDIDKLSELLNINVVATTARSKKGLKKLLDTIAEVSEKDDKKDTLDSIYDKNIENAVDKMSPIIADKVSPNVSSRWVSLRLLEKDKSAYDMINQCATEDISNIPSLKEVVENVNNEVGNSKLKDNIVTCIVKKAEEIAKQTITYENINYSKRDKKLDKILTSKYTGIPIMLLLLLFIFWLTITGANYPSQLLATGLFKLQDILSNWLASIGAPVLLDQILIKGVYRVLAWVVSVMLPPMAIFFPLFTLLEDFGYLPRVAFNLDHRFKRCNTCGKQALTMCMGFGCNAAGVTSCRIIDSPRERLIAIITNNFVPCNGRFPTLIALISMFLLTGVTGSGSSILCALVLVGVILISVCLTFGVSRLLSTTVLKGIPSSFTLELPPYRRPQIGKVIVRSIFDRTLHVLGRAIIFAAPAGLIIWAMANIDVGNTTLLLYCANAIDPFAKLMGIDGVILMAFILGFPANEIVIPIIIMAYMSTGQIIELDSFTELHNLLINNGWTILTAICTMLFSLIHWPCATTCMTIYKETKSMKWTAISILTPTLIGMVVCIIVASIGKIFI